MKKRVKLITGVIFALVGFLAVILFLKTASAYELLSPFYDFFGGGDPALGEFVANLIPVLILGLFTIMSYRNGNRFSLFFQQWLWWAYAIYILVKDYAFLDQVLGLGGFSTSTFVQYVVTVPKVQEIYSWFLLSLIVNTCISIYMSTKNADFGRLFIRRA